jgi:hypothetical protein
MFRKRKRLIPAPPTSRCQEPKLLRVLTRPQPLDAVHSRSGHARHVKETGRLVHRPILEALRPVPRHLEGGPGLEQAL